MRFARVSVLTGMLIALMLFAARLPVVFGEEKLVNINTASAAELAGLNGIGDAKAKAIVAYREKNGPFKAVDDLNNVTGIGDKLLAKLRPQVTVGTTAPAAPAAPAAKQ